VNKYCFGVRKENAKQWKCSHSVLITNSWNFYSEVYF